MAGPIDTSVKGVNIIHDKQNTTVAEAPGDDRMDDDEDASDWEYEYDADETEDIYVTLDLTSRVPEDDHLPRVALDTATGELRPVKDNNQSTEKGTASSSTDGKSNEATSSTAQNGTSNTASLPQRIKIADLHTTNPVIMVEDQVYSCTWASAIGTDLYFAPSSPSLPPLTTNVVRGRVTAPSANEYTPTHPLIGMTSARLIGQPAKLVPKDIVTEAADTTKTHEELDRKRLADQSNFLEAFQNLKNRIGETDIVPREGLLPLPQAQAHYDRVGMAISRGEMLTPSEIETPRNVESQGPLANSTTASETQNLNRVHSLLDVESSTLIVPSDPPRVAKRRPGVINEAEMSHQSRNARKKRRHSNKIVMYAEDEEDDDEEADSDQDGNDGNEEEDKPEEKQEQSGTKKKPRARTKSTRSRGKGKKDTVP